MATTKPLHSKNKYEKSKILTKKINFDTIWPVIPGKRQSNIDHAMHNYVFTNIAQLCDENEPYFDLIRAHKTHCTYYNL